MKVYGDLVINGSQKALDAFISALEQKLTAGWNHNHTREHEVTKMALGRMYCYACTVKGALPACDLWMATHSDGTLYVSNILAEELPSLTHDQYNAILSDFYSNCVKPAAELVGVEVKLGNQDPQLEDFLSGSTAKLLRSFSALANRSVLHPFDRRRWNEFLVSAYREGATLNESMLQRWLTEEERWPEDKAVNLVIEYEHSLELLRVYESQHA